MKKGDRIEHIEVESMAADGKCVARVNGLVLFLHGHCVPGDSITAELTKIKSSFLEGRPVIIEQNSPYRTQPFCSHFGLCGGCSWQQLNYPNQLLYKQQQVVDNLERIGGLALPPLQPIIGSAKTIYYRNKLDFTFTANRWLTTSELTQAIAENRFETGLGYHIPKMFDRVFDVHTCFLQPDPSNAIRLLVKEVADREKIPYFNLRNQTGFMRTLTIRTSSTGEIMVILQVTSWVTMWIEKILSTIAEHFPQVSSLNYVVNSKKNDTFADLDVVCWKGNTYITEQMPSPIGTDVLQFRIGPKSFYQTNSEQAFELYKVVWKMAALTGNETVYDLYTGTGTIANFVAKGAKKVIGIEYVKEAVENALINSQINHIGNTQFFAGDMKDLFTESFFTTHGTPEVVITDPPRAGMHESICLMLLKATPSKIIYVSCNPATQARDLKILAEKYIISAVQPVDMFPHTTHVENVVRLDLKHKSIS